MTAKRVVRRDEDAGCDPLKIVVDNAAMIAQTIKDLNLEVTDDFRIALGTRMIWCRMSGPGDNLDRREVLIISFGADETSGIQTLVDCGEWPWRTDHAAMVRPMIAATRNADGRLAG